MIENTSENTVAENKDMRIETIETAEFYVPNENDEIDSNIKIEHVEHIHGHQLAISQVQGNDSISSNETDRIGVWIR